MTDNTSTSTQPKPPKTGEKRKGTKADPISEVISDFDQLHKFFKWLRDNRDVLPRWQLDYAFRRFIKLSKLSKREFEAIQQQWASWQWEQQEKLEKSKQQIISLPGQPHIVRLPMQCVKKIPQQPQGGEG